MSLRSLTRCSRCSVSSGRLKARRYAGLRGRVAGRRLAEGCRSTAPGSGRSCARPALHSARRLRLSASTGHAAQAAGGASAALSALGQNGTRVRAASRKAPSHVLCRRLAGLTTPIPRRRLLLAVRCVHGVSCTSSPPRRCLCQQPVASLRDGPRRVRGRCRSCFS